MQFWEEGVENELLMCRNNKNLKVKYNDIYVIL